MRSAPPSLKIPIWDGATNLGVPRLKLPLFSCLRSFVPVVQPNLGLLPQKSHCSLSIVSLFDPYYCWGFLSFGTGRRYFNQLRSDSVGSHLLLLHCSNQYWFHCSDVDWDKVMKWYCLSFNPYVYWLHGKKRLHTTCISTKQFRPITSFSWKTRFHTCTCLKIVDGLPVSILDLRVGASAWSEPILCTPGKNKSPQHSIQKCAFWPDI